jgi:hypothetical protein
MDSRTAFIHGGRGTTQQQQPLSDTWLLDLELVRAGSDAAWAVPSVFVNNAGGGGNKVGPGAMYLHEAVLGADGNVYLIGGVVVVENTPTPTPTGRDGDSNAIEETMIDMKYVWVFDPEKGYQKLDMKGWKESDELEEIWPMGRIGHTVTMGKFPPIVLAHYITCTIETEHILVVYLHYVFNYCLLSLTCSQLFTKVYHVRRSIIGLCFHLLRRVGTGYFVTAMDTSLPSSQHPI